MFKFHINSFPISFQNYFQKVETIPNKSTKNSLTDDSYFFLDTTLKRLQQSIRYKGVKIWNSIPLKIRKSAFNLFKKTIQKLITRKTLLSYTGQLTGLECFVLRTAFL